MKFRTRVLQTVFRLFPFSLTGDQQLEDTEPDHDISCVINFYGRINLLEGILFSLVTQDLPRDRFEVILIEDRGGTEDGRNISDKFGESLNIKYFALPQNFGKIGYSRNFGLSKTCGKYILLLDDDTVLLQMDFLSSLIREFESSNSDAIVPHGSASFCVLKGKYDYHAPYYPTNRCMAYSRDSLKMLKGFVSDIVGQEDVEFVIRYIASGRLYYYSENLAYYHPPFILNSLKKAIAVGSSFAKLRKRYPFIVWLMLLINGSRHVPLLLFPFVKKWKIQGKFSLGFILGVIYSKIGKKVAYT